MKISFGIVHHRSYRSAYSIPLGSVANIPKELMPAHRPVWLIVHAFHKEETETLLQYAKDVARLEKINPLFGCTQRSTYRSVGGNVRSLFSGRRLVPVSR
jgi:hypothetical protein